MSNLTSSSVAPVSVFGLLRAALGLAAVALLVCGFAYSAAATGLGQLLFPDQGNGSLIVHEQKVVGSRLVAQPFVSDQYFYARPSAANYEVMSLSGSNLAQSNPVLQQQVQQRLQEISAKEQVPVANIPSDIVTTSGSGIDPDISVAAVMLQIPRIAAQRDIDPELLKTFVMQRVEQPTANVLGQSRVNVLELNWAMDQTFNVKK